MITFCAIYNKEKTDKSRKKRGAGISYFTVAKVTDMRQFLLSHKMIDIKTNFENIKVYEHV